MIITLHLFLKLLLVSCAGKKCQTRISNRCVDGECRCGMSPKCNPRSLERHCLAFDWTRPLKNDTTATCKSGIIILFIQRYLFFSNKNLPHIITLLSK